MLVFFLLVLCGSGTVVHIWLVRISDKGKKSNEATLKAIVVPHKRDVQMSQGAREGLGTIAEPV